MFVRLHICITGKVQGVFFRSAASIEAQKLNVKGWVRNLKNGRVEAIFEGEKENIKKLVEFCKKGPPKAIVNNIKISRKTYVGEFKTFEIKY